MVGFARGICPRLDFMDACEYRLFWCPELGVAPGQCQALLSEQYDYIDRDFKLPMAKAGNRFGRTIFHAGSCLGIASRLCPSQDAILHG